MTFTYLSFNQTQQPPQPPQPQPPQQQQELFLATPEDVLHRHMKRKGDRYQLDDGIDPHEDNYFARPIRTRPQQPNQQTVA
jgi:hypothetical protein